MGTEQAGTQVPDVVGFDADDACEMIRAAGLRPRGPGDTDPPTGGSVVDQEPVAAASVLSGSVVVVRTHGGGMAGDRDPGPADMAEPL